MISVSIVSHGQRDIALEFLRKVAFLKPTMVSRIVYTCNVPEEALPALDFGHIELQVIRNARPQGFGENHNAAFRHSREPYFCVVNPDIVLDTDPFPALLDCFSDSALGLVAPLVTTPSHRIENTARSLYTPVELLSQKLRPRNLGPDSDWLAGMFLLFRSEAFRAVHGFDEGYFLYIEDVDICTRLRVSGWKLRQCQDAQVVHDARKSSHRSLRYTTWHLGGMLRYWRSPTFWRFRRLLQKDRAARSAASGRLD